MIMLFRISVQLNVEPLTAHAVCSFQQLPVYFYLITQLIQLDCLNKLVRSRKAFWLFEQWFNVMKGENYQESESQTFTLLVICPRKFYFY